MEPYLIKALKVISNAFSNEKYETYLVGGCVRDLYAMRRPKDYDIATNATPTQIKEVCEKYNINYYCTGEQYGTITICAFKKYFELTTYRLDQNYSDGRRPSKVIFSDNLLDDLARRDFRMNAMAIKLSDYLLSDFTLDAIDSLIIDPYDGKIDINNKEINCVGNPSERFKEDGLRIMRAIRFAMTYHFKIGKETLNAIYENHICLDKISRERIQSEFNQIIMSFNLCVEQLHDDFYLHKWRLMTFIVKKIFPEMYKLSEYTHNNPYHLYDIFTHSLLVCADISTNCLSTKLAALFHDIGKMNCKSVDDKYLSRHYYNHPKESVIIAENILRRLKYSNDIINDTLVLIKYHDCELKNNKKTIKRLLNNVGEKLFEELLELKVSDRINHLGFDNVFERENKFDIINTYKEILNEQEAFSIKDLAISGDDLIQFGFKPGPKFKEILSKCLDYCIEFPEENTKEKLIKFIEVFK